MIFVVEVPHQAEASAWFAFDFDDLLRKIEQRAPGLLDEAAQGDAAAEPGMRCRIFWSEAEATAAFERGADPLWQGDGWRARLALREQLLATEVLADDA
jgi:hypothetical protein